VPARLFPCLIALPSMLAGLLASGGLADSVVSLFDVLNHTDYQSALIGKWHIASAADGLDHPKALGVNEYFGLYSGRANDYFDWQAVENGHRVSVNEYSTTAFTNRAIDWITQQRTPWFLWLAHNAPHAPFHLPPKHLHSFTDLAEDNASVRVNPLPYYQAMLEALDTELGRLLDALPAQVRANTIVMIASISGAGYESAVAHDFSKVLSGGETSRDFIFAEHFSDRPARGANTYGWAIRQNNMKLLNIDGKPQALYNVDADPMERVNLLANEPTAEATAIAAALNSKYRNLLDRQGQ